MVSKHSATTAFTKSEHSGHDHAHEHPEGFHDHGHSHVGVSLDAQGRISLIFRFSLLVTGLFVLVEFGAGLWSNSLALISDAGHNLTDAMALAFSWFTLALARRLPTPRKTYGYHRAGILAASINAATLVIIAFYVFYEGVQRLVSPEPVDGVFVMVVAALALLVNSSIAVALWRSAKDDINIKSAWLHVIGDALASVGAIIAGLGTWLTGSPLFDPVISMLLAVFILWSSWRIIKEAVNVLLEGIPAGLDMVSLMRDLLAVPAVKDIHDLHVWTIGSNFRALSCHILTANTTLQEANSTVQQIKEMLAERYQIHHATLELECESCELPEEVYCTVVRPRH